MSKQSIKEPAEHQYKFGRTKPGGVPAMSVAIPVGMPLGIILGIGLAMIPGYLHTAYHPWIIGSAIGLAVSPITVCLVWVLCVDRSTVPGAIPKPENIIETTWYNLAAQDSFHAVLIGTGIGSTLAMFWLPIAVSWTLVAVWFFAALAFVTSYVIRRSR